MTLLADKLLKAKVVDEATATRVQQEMKEDTAFNYLCDDLARYNVVHVHADQIRNMPKRFVPYFNRLLSSRGFKLHSTTQHGMIRYQRAK